MPIFGSKSKDRLATCNPAIRRVMNIAIELQDFVVLCGFRDEPEQNALYEAGKSQVKFPYSKHNIYPSDAVDVVPYPVDWNDLTRFKNLAAIIKQVARSEGVELEHGGDWVNFKDYPHWQIRRRA